MGKGGNKMKKLLLGTILLWLVMFIPIPAMAGVTIGVGISLPPIVFHGSPYVVAMPETYDVYFVPDIDVDLFFWNGWWWRPWEGRWYRSRYYDRGWDYYYDIPWFYFEIDPGWRRYHRNHNWKGYRWNYRRIPYHEFQHNWKSWYNTRYWERQRTWDVQKYRPQPQQQRDELRLQRHDHYQRRPGVQQTPRQEPRRQEQYQRRPEIQQPQRQQKTQAQPSQPRDRENDRGHNDQDRGDRDRGDRNDGTRTPDGGFSK